MNARDRLIVALQNDGEPDRVPSFVEGMMGDFKKNTLDKYETAIGDDDVVLVSGMDFTLFKFYKFDAVWLHSTPVSWNPLKGLDPNDIVIADGGKVNRFGHIHRLTRSTNNWKYQTGYLNTEELWKEWIAAGYFDVSFDPDWVTSWQKGYREMVDAHDLVPVPVTVCFEPIREAFDFGFFSHFYRKKPAFLKKLASLVTKPLLEVAKGWCDAGFEVVTWADDCAYKGRVMFPPSVFEDIIAPVYKTLNDYCHKRGVLTFFHSDGFTEPFFPGLIGSGFDGIQSLEPAAGMDLKHLKEEWGDKVCLIGNMDCSDLLPFGTEEQVKAATRKCLDDAKAGGGYIFGPTTDITDSCKPENVKAMMDEFLKLAWYQ
ncbi:MAG: uroporphyrinogen decarboxylase family protein [Candidatus Sigynarchaeota archaeon]